MTMVEGSSTDLESIVSNDNRPAFSGADRAFDPADVGSVLGGGAQPLGGDGGGGVQPLDGGGRSASINDRSFIGGAGSVRDQAGAGSVYSGSRSIENDDQSVGNNDVRRSFRREIGRPIFDKSRPMIIGEKITNRTWTKRKKMTLVFFRTSNSGDDCDH
jgi:hypothetical protein